MTVITPEVTTEVTKQQKISNLFPRTKPDNKFIDTSNGFTRPTFGMVKNWVVTEKIDGMNMRIHANQNDAFLIGGKTERAQIPGDLVENIKTIFNDPDGIEETEDDGRNAYILHQLSEIGYDGYNVTLFGEGYGPGIQGGAYYREDKGFILYDARFSKDDGRSFYAPFSDVQEIGKVLDIPVVRSFELQDATMIYNWMRETITGYDSEFEEGDGYECEGIVAYPLVPLYDSFGERIVFKLKVEEVRKTMLKEAEDE